MLFAAVDDLSEDKMKIIFMNGLLDEIRSEVKMFHPRTLSEMMTRARQVEMKNSIIDERYVLRPGRSFPRNQTQQTRFLYPTHTSPILVSPSPHMQASSFKSNIPTYSAPAHTTRQPQPKDSVGVSHNPNEGLTRGQNETRPSNFKTLRTNAPSRSVTSTGASTSWPRRENNFRRLSDDEFRAKVEKGLCFCCDEKFVPGHRCKFRQLRVMITNEEEGEEKMEDMEDEEFPAEVSEEEVNLNSSSVVGLDSPKTMKIDRKN